MINEDGIQIVIIIRISKTYFILIILFNISFYLVIKLFEKWLLQIEIFCATANVILKVSI